jgi:hypothetical protein
VAKSGIMVTGLKVGVSEPPFGLAPYQRNHQRGHEDRRLEQHNGGA